MTSEYSTRITELEDENSTLRAKVAALERETLSRSPIRSDSKGTSTLLESMSNLQVEDKENACPSPTAIESLRWPSGEVAALKSTKTPLRKVRKLTPRNNAGAWVEDDEDAFWGTP